MYSTYKNICKILGETPVTKTAFDKILPASIPDTTLIAVPDKVIPKSNLFMLAQEFGKTQPLKTYIYTELYELYSDEELSGKPEGNKVRFVHIQKEFDTTLSNKTVAEQKQILPKNFRVPSVLEAIALWYVLRDQDKSLTFDKTYIRHFDLEPKRLVGWSFVPYSFVHYDGGPAWATLVSGVATMLGSRWGQF